MSTTDTLSRITATLSPDRVFAAPAEVDGVTVIPAAWIAGGGGGGGSLDEGPDGGEGGGFGLYARPAGALVIDGGTVRWKTPFDLNKVIIGGQLVAIAYFFFGWLSERSRARYAMKAAKHAAAAAAFAAATQP